MKPSNTVRHATLTAALALALAGLTPVLPSPLVGTAIAADPQTDKKEKLDYENRLTSVRALAEALKRESAKVRVDNSQVLNLVAVRMKDAASLAAEGNKHDQAKEILDEGYRALTLAIAKLENAKKQGGTTGMTAAPETKPTTVRRKDAIARDLETTRALVDAFKRQDAEKKGGKASEIAAIETATQDASTALSAGELAKADALIGEALPRAKAGIASLQTPSDLKSGSSALEASQRAAAAETDSPRLRAIYARRQDSVAALLASGERIAKEKGMADAALPEAEKLLAEAKNQAILNNYPEAIATLERAYQLLKLDLREQRQGQVLTADKRFASPDEEYRYEQARNDDYLQLIDGLVQNRKNAAWTAKAKKGHSLRAAADESAKAGKWDAALRQIGDSTQQLKSVLKLAGFPIF